MKQVSSPSDPMIFANDDALAKKLQKWLGAQFSDRKICLVCVSNNESDVKQGFGIASMTDKAIKRVLVVFVGRPIDLQAMADWREWAIEKVKASDLRMDFVSNHPTKEEFENVVEKNCQNWFAKPPSPENAGIEMGQWVKTAATIRAKDDPSLLTMMFGSMGELLTEIEVVARQFSAAVAAIGKDAKQKYLKEVDSLLKAGYALRNGQDVMRITNVTDQLSKLLLRGESGVGKTLIADYLHQRCGLEGRPLHISIPEYLGKEDMFEYALFGYAAGNYTGGRKDGDHGLLLENVGGVIFLDEIGEANAVIQAKLLTFLDHYRIRPRGWLGDPFYCPVLIVAATNRDLDEVVEGKPRFRRDLLARFTDRHTIPALRERKGDLPFILDCLLQRESMNRDGFVKEIGQETVEILKGRDFRDGNFRELEDLFRNACQKAHREDRPYLVKSDFE